MATPTHFVRYCQECDQMNVFPAGAFNQCRNCKGVQLWEKPRPHSTGDGMRFTQRDWEMLKVQKIKALPGRFWAPA